MSNYNDNKKYGFNDASYSSKKSTNYGKKSPVDNDKIKIVGTRPVISRKLPPSGRQINFSQAGQ